MNTINMSNMVRETDIKCPICGAFIVCDESVGFLTNPIQHRYYCPKCGEFSHVTFSNECLLDYIKKNFAISEDSTEKKEVDHHTKQDCDDNYDCRSEAPHKCLNEKCVYAEAFKSCLHCMRHDKWFDITPVDIVNHPPHYESGKFECIDVMVETQGRESVMAFCLCNAFKYLYRHNNKNGVEDIKKAKWYIDKYLELEAHNETTN